MKNVVKSPKLFQYSGNSKWWQENMQDLNFSLILGDCEETVTTIEIDEETYEEVYRSTKRNIPMMYVRGDSVILVSPPSRSTN